CVTPLVTVRPGLRRRPRAPRCASVPGVESRVRDGCYAARRRAWPPRRAQPCTAARGRSVVAVSQRRCDGWLADPLWLLVVAGRGERGPGAGERPGADLQRAQDRRPVDRLRAASADRVPVGPGGAEGDRPERWHALQLAAAGDEANVPDDRDGLRPTAGA